MHIPTHLPDIHCKGSPDTDGSQAASHGMTASGELEPRSLKTYW